MKTVLIFFLITLPVFASVDSCYQAAKKASKWVAPQLLPVPQGRVDFINAFSELKETYTPYRKIRPLLLKGGPRFTFARPGERECSDHLYALYLPPDEIVVCQVENRPMGQIMDSVLREIFHWAQDHNLDLTQFITVIYNHQDHVLESARQFTPNPLAVGRLKENHTRHKEFLKSLTQAQSLEVSSLFTKLDSLERYHVIKTLPLTLGFLPKHPANVQLEAYRARLTPEILTETKAAERQYLALLQAHRNDKSFVARVKEILRLTYTVTPKFKYPIIYCQETQARIQTEALEFGRYYEVRDIPDCVKLYPHPLEAFASFSEFEAQIVRRAHQHVVSSPRFGRQFSEFYGLSGFPELFNPDVCAKIQAED